MAAAAAGARGFDGVAFGAASSGGGGGSGGVWEGFRRRLSPTAIGTTVFAAVLLVSSLFVFFPSPSYSDRFISSFSSGPKNYTKTGSGALPPGRGDSPSAGVDQSAGNGSPGVENSTFTGDLGSGDHGTAAARNSSDGSDKISGSEDSFGGGAENSTLKGDFRSGDGNLTAQSSSDDSNIGDAFGGQEDANGGDGVENSTLPGDLSSGGGIMPSNSTEAASRNSSDGSDKVGREDVGDESDDSSKGEGEETVSWGLCKPRQEDYIPCLDNWSAIKQLKSRRHMEHRERHCPQPPPKCLVALPAGYRFPVPWPRSRDMIWYNNAPHPKLVEFKKDQHWVQKSGDYFIFPGGGTQFKSGVSGYVRFIERVLRGVEFGSRTRVVLDVGCGVASFGGYLLEKNVITMSFAPKDEHEAQIQFALERGIPAFLAVIGTQKLPFPDNAFDLIHCARCRVHWDADGGKPLLELNRVLRPGGFYIWSATPVYRHNQRDEDIWKAMVSLTRSICWKMVAKVKDDTGIGLVVYQKPISNSCYHERQDTEPALCSDRDGSRVAWYEPLESCIPLLAESNSDQGSWPISWPDRLNFKYKENSPEFGNSVSEDDFNSETRAWKEIVSEVYFQELGVNWSTIRNVMDMNSGLGGFAAALIDQPLWVMNVVPVHERDTLPIIFNRGLIGVYHDWCESFNTYPRTYDLLHLVRLESLTERCDIIPLVAEMDRILRPGGWIIVEGSKASVKRLRPVIRSLQYHSVLRYETKSVDRQMLITQKGFWRPDSRR